MDYMISIVISFHNEEKNVFPLVEDIQKTLKDKYIFELILIDDISTDGTFKICNDLISKYDNISVIKRKENKGLGNALRDGFNEAKGEVIVTMDGDLSHQPKELINLLSKFNEGYDLVIGSRFIQGGSVELNKKRIFMSKSLAFFIRLSGVNVQDVSSGFRVYNSKLLKKMNLNSKNFDIQLETLLKMKRMNAKIAEVPIHYLKRKEGKSKLNLIKYLPGYAKVLYSGNLGKIYK